MIEDNYYHVTNSLAHNFRRPLQMKELHYDFILANIIGDQMVGTRLKSGKIRKVFQSVIFPETEEFHRLMISCFFP